MHKTFSSMGLVMMLLVGAVSPALAQGPGANSPPGVGRGAMGQKAPASNLTPDQETKIAALRAAAKEKAAPLRGELETKMVEMRQLWAVEKLSLSKMNCAGMRPGMMRGRMKAKNIDQLETMIETALRAGISMTACQMSMDIMGVVKEELIDGVELGGVASYLESASSAAVNLFI